MRARKSSLNTPQTDKSEKSHLLTPEDGELKRNLLGFFICGLLNNYSYVVMLCAAEDLVPGRAGVVLLCTIIPSLLTKTTVPFVQHLIPYEIRVLTFVSLSLAAFFTVAFTDSLGLKIAAFIFAGCSSGGGETTFLSLSSYYHKDTIGAWSSGTGGAGVFGSLSWLALTTWFGLSPTKTMFIIAFLPILNALSFFFILSGKQRKSHSSIASDEESTPPTFDSEPLVQSNLDSVSAKLNFIKSLLGFLLPLFLVYFSEYWINQGILPAVTFNSPLISDKATYYRYYGFLYQSGVFVSRSSVKFFPIRRVWVPAIFQVANVVFFMFEAYYHYMPSDAMYAIFGMVFWTGLLGGAGYVNVFTQISVHLPIQKEREFALGVSSLANDSGISLAGLVATFTEPWLLKH